MRRILALLLVSGATSIAPHALASSNRAWVSGHGVDQAGCGAPTSPCRSLQYAHDHIVGLGGEIDILDPAGYGAITITKSISIVNDGVGTAGVQATSGNAITINAGALDTIYLRGLNVDGVDWAGQNGIVLNTGEELTIDHCVVRHFNGDGIDLTPSTAGVLVRIDDTNSVENNNFGIAYLAQPGESLLRGTLQHVDASGDPNGGVSLSMGALTSPTVSFSIYDLTVTQTPEFGVSVDAPASNLTVDIEGSHLSQDADGLRVSGGTVHISRSTFNQNQGAGVLNSTSGGGVVFSTGDNVMVGNGVAQVSGTALVSEAQN